MISPQEYKSRRDAILAQLPPDAVAVIPAGEELYRNGDTHYPFRQNSHFWYLTGFKESSAVLVLAHGKSILFCQSRCHETEVWTGPILGPESAQSELMMDISYPIKDLEHHLESIFRGCTAIYYPFLQAGKWEKILFGAWKQARRMVREDKYLSSSFVDLSPILAEMRLIKTNAELQCIQKAVDCSVNAHLEVMKQIVNFNHEYQAAAIFHQSLWMQGCVDTAYPTIAASGPNACILHYTEFRRQFSPQDLFLIDAGGEWQGYAADITRTYPVRGQWTKEQQAIYELVLSAQEQAIASIRPGLLWRDMQQIVVSVLTQGLVDLRILTGSVEGLIEQQAYKPFYMHNSGHWLGLDVHDEGSYFLNKNSRPLEPGMVLTVEPGIYISPHHTGIDSKWCGIGIRIEDDVLVTSQGCKILSEQLPKRIGDIKARMSNA